MAPRRVNVGYAGQNFGFDLPEVSEEGRSQSESVLSEYFPELKLSFSPKTTRGGRLGRQSQSVTPEITLRQREAAAAGGTGGIGGAGGAVTNIFYNKPEEEQKEYEPKTFAGSVGSASISEIGNKGFGLKDLTAAIDAGYSLSSIKDYVEKNKDTLYNIGPGAQEVLGIKGYVSTTPGVFNYKEYGEAGFGMKDIQALEKQGVSRDKLITLARQAPQVGPEAQKYLGLASEPSAPASYPTYTPSASAPAASAPTPSWNYASYGAGGFGGEDLNAALAQGKSTAQIAQLAANAPGGLVGQKVRDYLSARGY